MYVLCLLAGVYETDVLCLLDLADHESLPQQDRLVLIRRRAETPFGERILSLMEARGLSLRVAARRVPYDARTCRGLCTAGSSRPCGWQPVWMTCWRRPGSWLRWRRRPGRYLMTDLSHGRILAGRPGGAGRDHRGYVADAAAFRAVW